MGTIADGNATEEEILKLLRKIKSDTDTIESLFKKVSDVIIMQPNFLGFGVDLSKLTQKILPKKGTKEKAAN